MSLVEEDLLAFAPGFPGHRGQHQGGRVSTQAEIERAAPGTVTTAAPKMYRRRSGRVLAGVAGGLADQYLSIKAFGRL